MDYQLENLGPERFQEFCQSLLVREFPTLQCFPVAQRDGGRDAIAYFSDTPRDEFIVFQVKFVRKPQAEQSPHQWLLGVLEEEKDKVKKLIPKGAKEYYLLTNVPGTAYPQSGSIDRAHVLVQKMTGIPSQCWWRGDITTRLDNAWDLKWAYPDLMSGQDMLRYLVEAGLSEDKERRTSAIRAFVRDQYDWEATVRFKQIELQNRLLDLFIDVPVIPREPQRERRARNIGYFAIMRAAQEAELAVASYDSLPTDPPEQPPLNRNRREDNSLGAATMLLHPGVQAHAPMIVLEGAPGQGKSTITQYVCQVHRMRILDEADSLDEVDERHRVGSLRLPVRVDLRDLATWFNRQDPFRAEEPSGIPDNWHKSLESFLAALIKHHAGGIDFTVHDLHAVAKKSAILLVLDGLDEVADIQKRREVVDEVVKGVSRLRESACAIQVVVTSRPAAFANSPGMPDATFQYCELGSLTRGLINAYATKWLKARKLQGREAVEVNRILKEKMGQPHLRDLARNPMQLAILLSLIHTRGASLPDKRTALYDSYVETFFSREAEKSAVVREHRELLIDIHRYLAWVLHSESEQGRSRGSLTTEEVSRHVRDYLTREEHDTALAEKLFRGMIERVVALVSRVEGTYEFEVQPLREYFAARYLYETATYSPPGMERGGTLPDRLDAMAQNFFWLNVVRFYSGCFSKGELPSLVERLEELVRTPGYNAISHPRVLAATLLSDWVFAQSPKSMKKVVALILDSLGLRRFVAGGGDRATGTPPLALPKQCGNEELVERCFHLLRNRPPRDFASSIIDLLGYNTTVADRRQRWRNEVHSLTGEDRSQWIDYGLNMQVLAELPDRDFDDVITAGGVDLQRLSVVFRLPQLERWAADEHRFSEISDAILDGDISAVVQSRPPRHVLQQLAHAQTPFRFGLALRSRHALPLSMAWRSQHFRLPPLEGDEASIIPPHQAGQRCAEFVQAVQQLAAGTIQDWSSSLSAWDTMVEHSRRTFGDRWTQRSIACIGSGIQSASEQCTEYPDLFDSSASLCRRARYARLRAGQSPWWEKQLEAAKDEADVSFALLILLSWGSPNCLSALADVIARALAGLSSRFWMRLWLALGRCIDVIHPEPSEATSHIDLGSASQAPTERLVAALGKRVRQESAAAYYKAHLLGYSGSDDAVLHFAQGQAIRLLFSNQPDQAAYLSTIERAYARGVMPERGLIRGSHHYELTRGVAETIASHPDRFPMDLVSVAEVVCKEAVSTNIVAVGTVAVRDKWFAT